MKLNEIETFPVWKYTQEICNTLKNSPTRFLTLTAETGAGKSTILPLGLLEGFSGKILVTEPRRLAVLGTANRVAELLEEECGQTCGYKVHLDKKISKNTRLEFITEAICVKQLQENPEMEGISVVVIDEFHERSIHTDMVLAFLKEAMELRDDLYVIVMSATINTERLQKYLECPVMKIPGRMFPVAIEYRPEAELEKVIIGQVQKGKTILVFIPSIGEIRKTQNKISEYFNSDDSVQIMILHSSITLEEQKKVLVPASEKVCRIVLASAIAETSLTVPGVKVVIDTGLSRINKIDLNTGMETLVTEKETEFSSEQRCGRAGRTEEGKCIRLWHKEDRLLKEINPEILRTNLDELILECAERGVYSRTGIDWFDAPLESGWNVSQKQLQMNGCLGKDGKITEKGRIALKLALPTRLACVAISGYDRKKKTLSEKAVSIIIKYSQYSTSPEFLKNRFLQDLNERLTRFEKEIDLIQLAEKAENSAESGLPLIMCGFADRLAMLTGINGEIAEYQFVGGKKAVLTVAGKPNQWIVAPEVLSKSGKGVIFDYEPIDEKDLSCWIEENKSLEECCNFENGKIIKCQKEKLGEIVIKTVKLPASENDYEKAWVGEVKEKGLEALPLDNKCQSLVLRWQMYKNFLCKQGNDSFAFKPDTTEFYTELEKQLSENVSEWLLPFITGGKKVDSHLVYESLYWYLNGAEIEKQVPALLVLENGVKCKVSYEKQKIVDGERIKPVIEIIIQRVFGCKRIPEICGEKVLLKLLSPASRPLQITEDLENFWTGAWKDICKEMKGRYPKHNWDYTLFTQ